jgi:glycine cleavage system aminomethyltransferase T
MTLARSPLHSWHAGHGARFADRAGWQVAASYSDPEREAEAIRSGLGLADVSPYTKISLRGPGVPALARSLVPGSPALKVCGVAPVPGLAALACRLTEDSLLLRAPPPALDLGQRLADLRQDEAVVQTDMTSAYAGIWVLGPPRDEFLRRLTHLDLRPPSFPEQACAETALAGVEVLLVRPGGPLPLVEVYVGWDLSEYVWERLWEGGQDLHITPVGLDALQGAASRR